MLSNNEHVSTNKLAEDDVHDADLHRLDEQVFLCKTFFLAFNIQYIIKIGKHLLRMWSTAIVTVTKKIFEMLITGYCDTFKKIYCIEASR